MPNGDPSGWNPSPKGRLNNLPVVGLAGWCGLINRSARLSEEERFPSEQIIIRPQGDAVPERAKRVRSARSTAGRGSEATDRRGGSPQPQKKTDYARPVIIPNATPTPRTEVPTP